MNLTAKRRTVTDACFVTPQLIFRIGWIFALLLIILQAGYFLVVSDKSSFAAYNDFLSAFSSLAAAFGMAYGAWWSSRFDRRLASAWWLFMFGMACWAAGDILWTYYDLVIGEVPYPSITDVFYLAAYPFFLIGILRLPRQVKSSTNETWYWLDVLIIMFSAGSIYWNFLIGPALSDHGQPWPAILVNSAYPFGDLLLILVITLIIFLPRSPLWLKSLSLMLVGHGLSIVADGVFAYQTLNETYTSGAFFNILFSIGPLALMMSGLSQAVAAWQVIRSQKTSPTPSRSMLLTLLRLAIPFIWLIGSFTLLRFSGTSKQALGPAGFSLMVSLLIILLAVRQVIATLENSRLADTLRILNDHLEKRVAERASDLLVANSELRREMDERTRIEMMLREREEKLAHFALHDALTTLPNRSLLIDRLTHAIQRYHRRAHDRYAILFLDLDGFKLVNDSLGHLAGDHLLVQISQRLASIVRVEDTVARLGGDEFVILTEGFGDENFPSVAATRILDSFKEPFLLDARTVYITASIGIVAANAAYQTAIEIMRDADLAMYEAKRIGKARYVLFSPELRLDAINRLTIDSDLRKALDQNELVLHYQPVISLATNDLVGFEALVRWQHPDRGLIGPSEFIPSAESSGVIDSITCYTLQEACRQLKEWQALSSLKETLFVSVNISPLSLRQTEFGRWVKESLRNASLPPHCLTLEIVETAFIQDADLASYVLNDLRQLGVRVCLDDFGIGYSSFGYINQYPIDILKVDRSFVNHVTETREVGAIVRAVTALTRELNLKAVAEGIETQAQLDFMKRAGCQYGQGYFLAKPMDATAVQSFLQKAKTSE